MRDAYLQAFADNLEVLQSNNEEYAALLNQQHAQNMRLEKEIDRFDTSNHELTERNAELRQSLTFLEGTRAQLAASVSQLQAHEAELDDRNRVLKGNIETLEASRSQLQNSVEEMTTRNEDLLKTADKLREASFPHHSPQ